ncbi:MAG TPA: hypothetical protein VK145_02655 [Candidatus Nanoarchaeia archaeon]|nr:hypothetical protein [Candidatus Nanoarchaeia archaeon]
METDAEAGTAGAEGSQPSISGPSNPEQIQAKTTESEEPLRASGSTAGQTERDDEDVTNINSQDERRSTAPPLLEPVAERSVPRVNGRLIQDGVAFGTEGLIYQVKGMATRRQADKTSFKRFKSNVTNAPFEGT